MWIKLTDKYTTETERLKIEDFPKFIKDFFKPYGNYIFFGDLDFITNFDYSQKKITIRIDDSKLEIYGLTIETYEIAKQVLIEIIDFYKN